MHGSGKKIDVFWHQNLLRGKGNRECSALGVEEASCKARYLTNPRYY